MADEETQRVKWQIRRDYAQKNRFKKYAKKHNEEVVSCTANLQKLEAFLNDGGTLQQALGFGYFGTEGEDIYRIGQTGIENAQETRLYIYAQITGPDIQVITIGDKSTQQADIRHCKLLVRKLKAKQTKQNQKRS